MPRKARIDAPGTVHHIIVRGIERRRIFKEDLDRERFLEKLGLVLTEGATGCFGWVLMKNHVHLLLRTGRVPLVAK
jgi:REP element-mobilizing transposase RayT